MPCVLTQKATLARTLPDRADHIRGSASPYLDVSMYMSAMLLTCVSIEHDYQRQQHLESMTATLP